MTDPRTMKKNLLQDLMQRARSSTQVGGVRFLSTNSSLRGSRTSLKSPKTKTTRPSSRRIHFPSVFRSHKTTTLSPSTESKTDSLKENARRSSTGKNKRPKSYCEDDRSPSVFSRSPLFRRKKKSEPEEERDKTLAEKVLQAINEKHTPVKQEKVRSQQKELSKTPQHVLYTTFEDNNLKTLLQNEDSLTVIPWKQDKSIPTSPGQRLTTKVSYCTSCGHVDQKTEVKEVKSENHTEKFQAVIDELTDGSVKLRRSQLKNATTTEALETAESTQEFKEQEGKAVTKRPEVIKKHRKLVRSLSDPLSSPRKEQRPRILHQQRRRVREAKITQTQTLHRRIVKSAGYNTNTTTSEKCNEQTIADLKQWKYEIQQNTKIFSGCRVTSDELATRLATMSKHKATNIENYCPLLKTKIPEEHIQEDGSVILRKGSTDRIKKSDADRDSGVDVDNACKTLYRINSSESEIDGTDAEVTVSPDSVLESAGETENQEFDFDTLKKSHEKTTVTAEETMGKKDENTTLTRHSSISLEDKVKWDMYALLRRFECVEWDLTPANNLKRQTLDLDNCDLDSVPAAVTEIEYYAFRDVEAVSLNHNKKIENADVLGKLADLRVINMWGCNLKSIPQTWSRLTKLQMLGLGNNKELSRFGPLKHLTNIVWLDLGGCGLKQIPDEVTNMMKLKVLALGGNPGIEIGEEILSLWDLKKLGLNDCELEKIPKSVFSLVKLTHLHLDNNYICQIDQQIVQLTELEELTVTGNPGINFPKILSQCDTIEVIIVDESKDLTRVSGTLKNRMRPMPTAISPVREPPPKPRNVSVS